MRSTHENTAAEGDPAAAEPAPISVRTVFDPLLAAIGRHPTAVANQLDVYLAAVVAELRVRRVLAGAPQRTDPAQRLIGSIVVDCTALRAPADHGDQPPAARWPLDARSLGAALPFERPVPVIVTWDEVTGWCAGLHHDSTRSSRRYLHPDLLPPAAVVAEFVVDLAEGRLVGDARPLGAPTNGCPPLRIVR